MKARPETRARAKSLRQSMTKAEAILWKHLKNRQVMGWQFRRQLPVGPYIADFACPRLSLIVEVDGGTHSSPDERAHDARRTAFLEAQGWSVLRFWNSEIYTNLEGVLRAISDVTPPKE